MIEFRFRKKVQPLFDKLGTTFFIPCQISPNEITLYAFFSGLLAGFLVYVDQRFFAVSFLLLSGLLDIMDGTVARITKNSQKIGAYIDLIADRMVEAAIIVGFALLYPQHYMAYILFFAAVMFHFSTFIAAGALFPNMGKKSMHYDHSTIERAEAFVVFVLMIVLPQYVFPLLTLFSLAIMFDGLYRFIRVLDYARYNIN